MSLRTRRGAFTLVELLVAMTIIVVLASLTLMVVVNMGERDGTTDAAGLTRQWLMISKNRAARDHAPRGLRLIVGTDPNNVDKTSPYWVTELQYIEQPPPYQPNPNGSSGPSDPYIVFTVPIDMNGNRGLTQCYVRNLTYVDASQIQPSSWVAISGLSNSVPAFGARVLTVSPNPIPLVPNQVAPMDNTRYTIQLTLDRVPDDSLGASGFNNANQEICRSYSFSVTLPPQPIMGEPPLQLPKNICIDVSTYPYTTYIPRPPVSPPAPSPPPPPYFVSPSMPSAVLVNYDILFSPAGHVLPVGAGASGSNMIHLWHRDYTKLKNAPRGNNALVIMNSVSTAPYPAPVYDMYPFENGGVQQLVTIRCKTGSLGQFPVMWPDAGGSYSFGDPYYFANQGTTSP